MEYKEYLITEFVNEKEQWQAHIRPKDGKHISVEGTTLPVFTTMRANTERGDQNCKRGNRHTEDFGD